jgi:hypothetical protein
VNSQITALLHLGADAMSNMYDVTFTAIPSIIKDKMNSDQTGQTTGGSNVTAPPSTTSQSAPEAPTPDQSNALTLRANGFEPPKFNIKKYDIRYKTVGLKRPATRIEGDRSFKITFRVDSYYNIYRMLMLWRSVLMEPATGYATNALWGAGSGDDLTASANSKLNALFGQISVVALAKPIYMKSEGGFIAEQAGVTSNTMISTGSKDYATWEFDQVWISDIEEPKYKAGEGDILTVTATFEFGEYRDPTFFWYSLGTASTGGGTAPINLV